MAKLSKVSGGENAPPNIRKPSSAKGKLPGHDFVELSEDDFPRSLFEDTNCTEGEEASLLSGHTVKAIKEIERNVGKLQKAKTIATARARLNKIRKATVKLVRPFQEGRIAEEDPKTYLRLANSFAEVVRDKNVVGEEKSVYADTLCDILGMEDIPREDHAALAKILRDLLSDDGVPAETKPSLARALRTFTEKISSDNDEAIIELIDALAVVLGSPNIILEDKNRIAKIFGGVILRQKLDGQNLENLKNTIVYLMRSPEISDSIKSRLAKNVEKRFPDLIREIQDNLFLQ
ncbi:MAG: hypothetical protein HN411_04300 [Waddliaceae bacterium]|jgi:hypothetical protein|nr:hypothetical protein [Waddliaceae bacterium]MBT3578821.1 hypothetical protein [Waddliaceae bacterium]MBT4445304.1 hypothetical protein [Waddliaceae bacterium]MBT6928774.1 hypothetical protein [Waddliaceae bacterium]MBT7263867.1 hypothetical protein [Waddliaceae bacterium]